MKKKLGEWDQVLYQVHINVTEVYKTQLTLNYYSYSGLFLHLWIFFAFAFDHTAVLCDDISSPEAGRRL